MNVSMMNTAERYRKNDGKYCIDIFIENPDQLFDWKDPAPFRYRDLDDDFVRFVLQSAREIGNQPFKIVINSSAKELVGTHETTLIEAIRQFFSYEKDLVRNEISSLFRYGRMTMFFAVVFLFTCIRASTWLDRQTDSVFYHAVAQGLTILGWVAMWRPVNIFLYDWWPLYNKMTKYAELKDVEIDFRYSNG